MKVLGIGRRRQNKDEMENGVIVDIAGVIQNCNFAIKEAEKMAGCAPGKLVLGVAGELIKVQLPQFLIREEIRRVKFIKKN